MIIKNKFKTSLTLAALAIAGFAFIATTAAAKPLKVYILAGQSNMEGHGAIRTLDYMGGDPQTVPMLKEIVTPEGKLQWNSQRQT